MPVTLLDLIVIGVMLISALLAMVRGFTREVLSIAAWVLAAAAALFLHPYVEPYLAKYIHNPVMAQLAAGGAVFVVVLILVSFITIRISDLILDSRVGAIDRSLGFVFGAARGFLLAVVAFLFFAWLVPDRSQPVWVQDAKVKPYLLASSDYLEKMLPADAGNTFLRRWSAGGLLPAEGDNDQDGTTDTAPTPPTAGPATSPGAPGSGTSQPAPSGTAQP